MEGKKATRCVAFLWLPELRSNSGLWIQATLTILTTLASLSARSLQDNLFPGIWKEVGFQKKIQDELRRQPQISSKLEEHAHAGGGITDLSFKGVRIELKAESAPVTMADCERFAEQTISYVVATGKRIGVLCVLDCGPKATPPSPAEEGIGILCKPTQQGGIRVVTIIVQGNLARPSDLSR